MTNLQRQISMCSRHHAKWRRAASFARNARERERYLERANYWMDMQSKMVSIWSAEQDSEAAGKKRPGATSS